MRALFVILSIVLVVGSVAFALIRDPETRVLKSADGFFAFQTVGVKYFQLARVEGAASTARVRPIYRVSPKETLVVPATIIMQETEQKGAVVLAYWDEVFQAWKTLPTELSSGAVRAQTAVSGDFSLLQVQSVEISEADRDALVVQALSHAPERAILGEFFLAHAFEPGDFVQEPTASVNASCPGTSLPRDGESQVAFFDKQTLLLPQRSGMLRLIVKWTLGDGCSSGSLTLLP